MKILFLCGSAEPGKDGVGDYTRRLAGALIRKGYQAEILSLCDKQANSFITENQEVENTSVKVNRIPMNTSTKQRLVWSQSILDEFQPNWISLQFVPYSFHPKGLPFWLPRFFKKLKGHHQWHIMFHELWLGMENNALLKYKVYGFFQKKIITKLLKIIKPKVIHTQIALYKFQIETLGYKIRILPLYSNIPTSKEVCINKKPEVLLVALFGTIHLGASIEFFVDELKSNLATNNSNFSKIKFIFIGNCGPAIEEWVPILRKYNLEFEITGRCSDTKISQLLSVTQLGITTTPWLLVRKSGTVAAMLEHNMQVVCVAHPWQVTKFKNLDQGSEFGLYEYKKGNLEAILLKNDKLSHQQNLEFITLQFIQALNQKKSYGII